MTTAFHGCRSAVVANCPPADAWRSSQSGRLRYTSRDASVVAPSSMLAERCAALVRLVGAAVVGVGDWGMAVSASVPGGREGDPDAAFAALQARLRPFESTDDAARADERTGLAVPSINLDQEL